MELLAQEPPMEPGLALQIGVMFGCVAVGSVLFVLAVAGFLWVRFWRAWKEERAQAREVAPK